MNEQRNRPQSRWVEDKVFENEEMIVQVNRLPLRTPKFSISINAKNRDGRPMRFLPMRGNASNGVFTIRPILADLRELLDAAEGYVEKQLQLGEDQRIDDIEKRESRNASRGPQQKPGLKELSKRDRQKRQRERESEKNHNE